MAKTKALISFAVTAKLVCAFVFAYADCWFSHAAAQYKVFRTKKARDDTDYREMSKIQKYCTNV